MGRLKDFLFGKEEEFRIVTRREAYGPAFAAAQDALVIHIEDFPEWCLEQPVEVIRSTEIIKPTPLIFSPGEPTCFWEHEGGVPFRGQKRNKERLDVLIRGIPYGGRFKALVKASPGSGKTALMQIIAHRIHQLWEYEWGITEELKYVKILPGMIESKAQMDMLMRWLAENPYTVVFIDEVHKLPEMIGSAEPFYAFLDDTGEPTYPLSQGKDGALLEWLPVPPTVCWIGATTDAGTLHPAVRRRLEPSFEWEEYKKEELAAMLEDRSFPITKEAAMEIAARSPNLPWQALKVFEEAQAWARVGRDDTVHARHCFDTFRTLGLDVKGLMPRDRKVIETLLAQPRVFYRGKPNEEIAYGASEAYILAACGFDRDKELWTEEVQPKLRKLGYLTVRPGLGQALTQKAIFDYGGSEKPAI